MPSIQFNQLLSKSCSFFLSRTLICPESPGAGGGRHPNALGGCLMSCEWRKVGCQSPVLCYYCNLSKPRHTFLHGNEPSMADAKIKGQFISCGIHCMWLCWPFLVPQWCQDSQTLWVKVCKRNPAEITIMSIHSMTLNFKYSTFIKCKHGNAALFHIHGCQMLWSSLNHSVLLDAPEVRLSLTVTLIK